MAAADIALNDKIATVESDDTARRIDIGSAGASLVNVGSYPIFISMVDGGDLDRDGLQHDGEIQLDPNDSVPIPVEASFIRHQCAATQTSKLWFIPRAG